MAEFNFAHGHALRVSLGPGSATVNLTPGAGLHRLAATVTVISIGLPEGLPIQLNGDLYMELTDAHRWLGPLHTKQISTRGFQTTEQLTCGLSDTQLHGIEALRDGRDLPLRLHLDAVLRHPVDELYPVISVQEAGTVPAARRGHGSLRAWVQPWLWKYSCRCRSAAVNYSGQSAASGKPRATSRTANAGTPRRGGVQSEAA